MPDLPPELANIPRHLVAHSYTTGSRGRYHWIQSVAEDYFFTAVINDQAAFQSLMESAPFTTVEQRKRDALCQYVRATELAECGEEKCLESGCTRLSIRQSALCWVHQFLWAHPDWKYANTPKS